MIQVVTRLGVHRLYSDRLEVFNHTTDMLTGRPYFKILRDLTPEQVERWRVYLSKISQRR